MVSGSKLIARAGGENDEIREALFARCREAHVFARSVFTFVTREQTACASGCDGAIEQQAIQHFARVNHDGMAHFESRAMAAAGNQFGGADDFFGLRGIEQEGIGFDGFVSQAAAAGLFPREALVEDRHLKSGAGQTLAAERTGRTSSDDGDFFHVPCCDLAQVSGNTAAMNQEASIAPNNAAAVAEPVRDRNASVASRCRMENSARYTNRSGMSTWPLARKY